MAEIETVTQSEERQLVVFDLGGEVYGVDINSVREIIRMQAITRVPNAPEFVEGIINLRGKVIPIIDLRKRFSLEIGEETAETRIVVVDIAGEDIGVTVDAVTEVMRIASDAVEPTGDLIATDDSYYIEGIANLGESLIILLDLDKVLSKEHRTSVLKARDQAVEANEAAAASKEEGEDGEKGATKGATKSKRVAATAGTK
ncbi:MAG: purine-binding chemotaxis protein CheW [Chloroflexi bacterium]|nr:purine-binding chemotaxis protein CheW [Chloroflexota bacterium]